MNAFLPTLILLIVMSLALPSEARGQGKQDPLVSLSNSRDMVQRTKKVNHCGARQAREIRAQRNAFFIKSNIQQSRPDSIVIIETRRAIEYTIHVFCNDSSGTPKLMASCETDRYLPLNLRYRKYYLWYYYNMDRHVRDIECMGNISKMAERAFATGGDKSQIKLLFEPYRYLDSHNVYYLWLVVREGNEYRTVSYNRFVGDFVHHEAEPAIDSGFIDEE